MKADIRDLRVLVRRTLSWWLPLGVVMTAVTILLSPDFHASRGIWGLVELAVSKLGFTLPFVTFVTGLAAVTSGRTGESRAEARQTILRILMAASMLAAVGYALGNVVEPRLEYRYSVEEGVDVAERYPFGPLTPGNRLRQLKAAAATSPDDYSFSTSHPRDHPPNWLTYQLHLQVAFAAFALPNALLGYLVALLTVHLRPIRRRQARWAAGLGASIVFLAAGIWLSRWVRLSPDNSGTLAAWVPLLAPCVLVLATWRLVARAGVGHPSDWDGNA